MPYSFAKNGRLEGWIRVAPDNTVAWNGRRLQIPPHPARAHFVRAKVRVHHYVDGEIAIFHGPRCLVACAR